MILTKEVLFRGKPKSYEELKNHSLIPIEVECDMCHKHFTSTKYQIVRNGHECCAKCIKQYINTSFLKGGEKYGKLTIIKFAGYIRGEACSLCKCDCGNEKIIMNRYIRTGHTKSCGCLQKECAVNNAHNRIQLVGESHPNWRGGVSSERQLRMASKEYKNFRKKVFIRDNYTCQKCGQKGYKLNAHHIYNYVDFPELRTDINNGITLCEKCHKQFHSIYGYKKTNKEMMDNYLKVGWQV